jgi:homocysteine S-methyltransferase
MAYALCSFLSFAGSTGESRRSVIAVSIFFIIVIDLRSKRNPHFEIRNIHSVSHLLNFSTSTLVKSFPFSVSPFHAIFMSPKGLRVSVIDFPCILVYIFLSEGGNVERNKERIVSFEGILKENGFVLAEASVVESLRRSNKVQLHPRLVHALLIYDGVGKEQLSNRYCEYIAVAKKCNVPIITLTPTWRANKERLSEAGINSDVNGDAVEFMKQLRNTWGSWQNNISIGGLIGCRNDCYRASEAIDMEEARDFHSWQVEKLAEAGVDFLIAETLPALCEAIGIAQAMAATKHPYVISFVINRKSQVLDGTSLEYAFRTIDTVCDRPPVGYMINCSHPSFLRADEQPDIVLSRLIGMQANASSMDQVALEVARTLQVDDIPTWGKQMVELNTKHGVKILGGCCGTGVNHLQYIVDHVRR